MLAGGGAPESLARPVVHTLGERAGELLRADPWQLLCVPGVRVEQADSFARALLGPAARPEDRRRAQALVGWVLERAAGDGNSALDASAVRATLAEHAVPDPDQALREAVADGRVLVFHDEDDEERSSPGAPRPAEAETPPPRVLLALDRYALAEESLADALVRLLATGPADGGGADLAAAAQHAPSPSAAELIRAAAGSGLVTHSGGEAAQAEPAALVAAARTLGLRAWVVTATEDSRRRLVALLPAGDAGAAVTLTGLLSDRDGPGRNEDGTLAVDLLAVCDAPQLDVEIAATLAESIPDGVRVVFSGDPGVLWSAGAGRVFADLLLARVCPRVVSRVPDPGPLGELTSSIGAGELPPIDAGGRDVVVVPARSGDEAVHRTVQLVTGSIPRVIGVPAEQIQVITPVHGGAAGTRALNAALKASLNPGPGRYGGFDPGDRIAYVPVAGRTLPGTVVSADQDGLRLDCAGSEVVVEPGQAGTVRHGWALTAHQAAGMRWPAVVVVLPGDAVRALTRQWVYTAFGRAERHLSVVQGVGSALPRIVADVAARPRTTRLSAILAEQSPPAQRPDSNDSNSSS